ncbi:endonuclease-3 [Caulobacter segnis]|nr:endonuclease-3 [Caulobacter segnis]
MRDALLCEFGPQRPVTRMDPVSQLVKSSISGRTLDAVSWGAFLRLRAEFKNWDDLADAPVAAVARIIEDVTFPADKARYLTTALRMIRDKVGWLSLSHLKSLTVDQARWELQALPGVGVKVAACVLNFSDLAMRALVVDSHVDRVAKRIGLVGAGDTTHTYHTLMGQAPDAWTADDLFELHWLMKRGLGQMLCPHEGPKCGACPVKAMCAKVGVGHSADVLSWRPREVESNN